MMVGFFRHILRDPSREDLPDFISNRKKCQRTNRCDEHQFCPDDGCRDRPTPSPMSLRLEPLAAQDRPVPSEPFTVGIDEYNLSPCARHHGNNAMKAMRTRTSHHV